MNKNVFAKTPPMGWNSWDCYGAAVTEEILLKNTDYMAEHLKKYGWEYIVCDIQWYEPTADSSHYHLFADLSLPRKANKYCSSYHKLDFLYILSSILYICDQYSYVEDPLYIR